MINRVLGFFYVCDIDFDLYFFFFPLIDLLCFITTDHKMAFVLWKEPIKKNIVLNLHPAAAVSPCQTASGRAVIHGSGCRKDISSTSKQFFIFCSTSTRMDHLSGSEVVADYLNCCNLWDGAVKKIIN